ncbi:ATP-binding cassette domain-containing protein [Aurantimonas aggregata]|uniref:ATP-binding cassette domain-containing protein n=1 Tax=Aurantimonas aggregata TaxID=2047720 RepID=A0A6L9MKQ8_9HYPH|nr:ABC transporter ATP-binding protein [Aurantimonas aggregata]NDV88216.1 ATP-binding cassette domain-containing protein [Aurantimonas aggregata]
MSDVVIRLHGISKWFKRQSGGDLHVLADVCIDVPRHSKLAIVGASGSGKSTLLNIIAGLVEPDGGRVVFCGQPVGERSRSPSMTYMFQDDRLLPWRSAARNVHFGLESLPLSKAERDRRVAETLAMVNLGEFADTFPHELSGGMRSRVALARSLVSQPSILLMDEPFSKLDPSIRTQMHDEVIRLSQQLGMTVIFVTHDVEEAVVLAENVVVLSPRPGRVHSIVPITLPYPRDPLSTEMNAMVRDLRRVI